MRVSTVAVLGIAVAVGGFGAYKLGHGVSGPAGAISTLAVALPQEAAVAADEANLAGAVTAAAAYQGEHGGYAGMSTADLHAYSGALGSVVLVSATANAYCVESTIDATTVSLSGPDGTYATGPC
jgi:hypothetical protein